MQPEATIHLVQEAGEGGKGVELGETVRSDAQSRWPHLKEEAVELEKAQRRTPLRPNPPPSRAGSGLLPAHRTAPFCLPPALFPLLHAPLLPLHSLTDIRGPFHRRADLDLTSGLWGAARPGCPALQGWRRQDSSSHCLVWRSSPNQPSERTRQDRFPTPPNAFPSVSCHRPRMAPSPAQARFALEGPRTAGSLVAPCAVATTTLSSEISIGGAQGCLSPPGRELGGDFWVLACPGSPQGLGEREHGIQSGSLQQFNCYLVCTYFSEGIWGLCLVLPWQFGAAGALFPPPKACAPIFVATSRRISCTGSSRGA